MIFWLYQGPFWWDMWWFPGGYNGISSSIRTRDINGASNLHPCPGGLELGGENRARKVALFLEKKTVAKNRYTQHLSVPHSCVCEQVCETPCNNRLFSLHPISEVVHFLVRSPSLNRKPNINIQTSMQHGAIVAGFFRAQMPELFAAPFGFSASNLDTPIDPSGKKPRIPMNRLLLSSALLALALAQNETTANGTVMSEGLKVRSMSRPVSILHISDTHSLHRSTGNLPDAATCPNKNPLISYVPRSFQNKHPTSRCCFQWSGVIIERPFRRSWRCQDIFIHSGDVAKVGSESELGDFNDWLGSIKHKYQHMLVIAGILTWIFFTSHLAGLFDFFVFFWAVVVEHSYMYRFT